MRTAKPLKLAKINDVSEYRDIIADIIDRVASSPPQEKKLQIVETNRIPNLVKKIKLNFNEHQYEYMRSNIALSIENINIVAKFITEEMKNNRQNVFNLASRVQDDYLDIRNKMNRDKTASPNSKVEDFAILTQVAKNLLKPEQRTNTTCLAAAKAVVLYFFEKCDVGAAPENSPMSIISEKSFGLFTEENFK